MRHTTHQSDSIGGFGYRLIHSIAITLDSPLKELSRSLGPLWHLPLR
ncbi:MAG: hypothetical protein KGQ86_08870 [Bacteroidetes bacterium]|nr:hypothetical protein [Bacteroidota bacterium]